MICAKKKKKSTEVAILKTTQYDAITLLDGTQKG